MYPLCVCGHGEDSHLFLSTTTNACTECDCNGFDRPSSDLNGATDEGLLMAYPSTPGEFAARWNKWDEDHRAKWLRMAIQAGEIVSQLRQQGRL